MQRLLITIGFLILILGLLWPWVGKLPLGRLPGDILIEREGLRLYLPITTMLLISALITLVLWFLRR